MRRIASMRLLDRVSIQMTGEAAVASRRIGPARMRAQRSGSVSASCFGTSSPRITDRNVMNATTRMKETSPAASAPTPVRMSTSFTPPAIFAPPYAPAMMPMRVMPT